MSTIEKRFRRNFVLACFVHAALIAGIILFEGVLNRARSNVPVTTELITPADILGDLPVGPGHGRGQYTAPPPEPAHEASAAAPATAAAAAPSAPVAASAPEPRAAPKAKAASVEKLDPNEVAIPKKQSTKQLKKPADGKAEEAETNGKSSQKSVATTKKTVATAKSSTQNGSSNGAESAAAIRRRFASALASADGGSEGGDNQAPGGGDGVSRYGRLGSPEGAADGIAGGVGKGSPFWSYYLHVHDVMYEAWEQPGKSADIDKKLVTTILLRVARDGRIDGVKLQHSSGNELMDNSALSAARSVPKLDPLPEGLGGDFAEISVNFRLEG
ncbi:MAG TPA: TonB family protein [Verrucomicrobiae bacterium]|nr:TonB family protein [Verrucomicrobiae bacterium]